MRELNASPDSVSELKKIWSYIKREDGTLVITSYKGDKTEVTYYHRLNRGARLKQTVRYLRHAIRDIYLLQRLTVSERVVAYRFYGSGYLHGFKRRYQAPLQKLARGRFRTAGR